MQKSQFLLHLSLTWKHVIQLCVVRVISFYFWHFFLRKECGLCFSTHFPQEEWVRPIFDGRCPACVRKSITVIFLRVFFCFGQRTVSNRKYCRLSLELALTTDCTNLWNDQRSHQLVPLHDSGFKSLVLSFGTSTIWHIENTAKCRYIR